VRRIACAEPLGVGVRLGLAVRVATTFNRTVPNGTSTADASFGSTVPGSASTRSAVPEPIGALANAAALAALGQVRMRRAQSKRRRSAEA
jgi:hypothetical protein